MRNKVFAALIVLIGLVVFPASSFAHGGGLNKCGCHIDHATNTCHCHRAPYGGCGPECYSQVAPASESCEPGAPAATAVIIPALYSPQLVEFVAAANEAGNPDTKVWVNTSSGVYHCPGTRWYGNTKSGKYLSQAEAQKAGYRPAYGKVCQ